MSRIKEFDNHKKPDQSRLDKFDDLQNFSESDIDKNNNETGEMMEKEKRDKERRLKDRRLKIETEAQNDLISRLKGEVGAKDADIQKLNNEIESIKDLIQRRQADFENFKKRNLKQQEYNKKYAIKDFALDIIMINDDLLRVIEASSNIKEGETIEQSHNSFVQGISMISRRFENSLNKNGIMEIEAQGLQFNPNFHEAVEIELNGDIKCDTVTKIHQKGFRIDDMVVRPAKVKVTKPIKNDNDTVCVDSRNSEPVPEGSSEVKSENNIS